MKLTKKRITDDLWKKHCLPFLCLGLIIPGVILCCLCMYIRVALIIATGVFAAFLTAFLIGAGKVNCIRKNDFFIDKQKLSGKFHMDSSVDNNDVRTHYITFRGYASYKLRGDDHPNYFEAGSEYYLVVKKYSTKILTVYNAVHNELDNNDFVLTDDGKYEVNA